LSVAEEVKKAVQSLPDVDNETIHLYDKNNMDNYIRFRISISNITSGDRDDEDFITSGDGDDEDWEEVDEK